MVPSRVFWASALALLVIMVAAQVSSVRGETATWDEPVHLMAGYSYWVTGSYEGIPDHPPLVRMLCALPLYLHYRPSIDTTSDAWKKSRFVEAANLFLYRNTTAPETMLLSGRCVTIALTALLAAYLAWWTRRRFGAAAALFALALFVFDPNLLAHGRYVTTDLGAALFIFTTCTLWLEYLESPRALWLVLTGLSLGAALTAKYSTVYLIPFLLLMYWWRRRGVAGFLRCAAVLLAASVAVLVLVYWPEVRRTSLLPPLAPTLTRKGPVGGLLGVLADRLHMPAYTYFIGLDRVSEHDAVGHYSYLLGRISDRGFWYYFPVAFAVKSPLASLAAFAVALFLVVQGAGRRFIVAALAVSAAVYFALAMLSHIDIGFRHLLPVFPLLYAAAAAVLVGRPRKWVWALPLVLAVESFAVYPHYLGFFNLAAGGPDAGPRYLLDSNLDWGQEAGRLGQWLRRNHVDRICISFFGNVDLPRYGVYSDAIPAGMDPRGLNCVTAISATPLFGLYVGPERFAWVRTQRPIAIIGHSIYVYDFRKGRM